MLKRTSRWSRKRYKEKGKEAASRKLKKGTRRVENMTEGAYRIKLESCDRKERHWRGEVEERKENTVANYRRHDRRKHTVASQNHMTEKRIKTRNQGQCVASEVKGAAR